MVGLRALHVRQRCFCLEDFTEGCSVKLLLSPSGCPGFASGSAPLAGSVVGGAVSLAKGPAHSSVSPAVSLVPALFQAHSCLLSCDSRAS